MNTRIPVLCLLIVAWTTGCARGPETTGAAPAAAGPAATDIWVAEFLESGRRLRVGTPRNVTDRDGYDNQPHFLPDGSGFLYTSIHADGQAEIHVHEFARGRNRRLTRTAESEYSPTPLAGGGFSVIRVEADGTQRLWAFDAQGGTPRLLLETPSGVGYQAWVDARIVALFLLGQPPSLAIVDTVSGAQVEVLRSVGRSLHPVPGRARVSALHKATEDEWNIVEIDPAGGEPVVLAPALAPAEDFTWTPDGTLLMARGSVLYQRPPGEAHEWIELADFEAHGLMQITRIAVSPNNDRIALVGQR